MGNAGSKRIPKESARQVLARRTQLLEAEAPVEIGAKAVPTTAVSPASPDSADSPHSSQVHNDLPVNSTPSAESYAVNRDILEEIRKWQPVQTPAKPQLGTSSDRMKSVISIRMQRDGEYDDDFIQAGKAPTGRLTEQQLVGFYREARHRKVQVSDEAGCSALAQKHGLDEHLVKTLLTIARSPNVVVLENDGNQQVAE